MRRRGFTLIELLVVIAIIAILAAILFPVFAQARAAARKTSCLSNVKQLTLGFMQYVQDYDEKFPAWDWGFYCNGANAGAPRSSTAFWTNAIYPYTKNTAIYRCPDDILQWDDGWATCSDDQGRNDIFGPWYRGVQCDYWAGCNPNYVSYGISEAVLSGKGTMLARIRTPANWALMGDSASQMIDVWWWDGSTPTEDKTIAARGAFASQPEGCCMMWTCCHTVDWWMANYTAAVLDNAARHQGGENIGFVDGHAKYRVWKDMQWVKLTIGSR